MVLTLVVPVNALNVTGILVKTVGNCAVLITYINYIETAIVAARKQDLLVDAIPAHGLYLVRM